MYRCTTHVRYAIISPEERNLFFFLNRNNKGKMHLQKENPQNLSHGEAKCQNLEVLRDKIGTFL